MKSGEFRASDDFDWLSIGVPPPWDVNPVNSTTWDLWRHSLFWLDPLVAAWWVDGDEESLALVEATIRDWQAHNPEPPGASSYAWSDHSIANRLGYFCRLWELYRASDNAEPAFASFLLELIHRHAEEIDGGRTYDADSNHGMLQNAALLVATVAVPEFAAAERWRATAYERMSVYVAENFSAEGFHLEQSPGYHLAALYRLGSTSRFLRVHDRPAIETLDSSIRRAATVWPWLIRSTGALVDVGDTWATGGGNYRSKWEYWWGSAAVSAAESTLPNPRNDAAGFLLSFGVGYAIFTAYPIEAADPDPDTYVFFKCNAFPYTHYHRDALSFLLTGLGQDWIIDSGVHSHNEHSPERIYVRGPRAHSVVLVDESDFRLGPVHLVDYGRTSEGDFVTAAHELPNAQHERQLTFVPPVSVNLRDWLSATDGLAHTYTQVYQIEPALEIKIISDQRVHLVNSDGRTCVIEQHGVVGQWRVVVGQTEPYWQGWHSPGFEEIEPAPTLYYSNVEPVVECEFQTSIRLTQSEP
jgi:hypothetical protein